jgi:hypothetical protein
VPGFDRIFPAGPGDEEFKEVLKCENENDDDVDNVEDDQASPGKAKKERKDRSGDEQKRQFGHEPLGERPQNPRVKWGFLFIHLPSS